MGWKGPEDQRIKACHSANEGARTKDRVMMLPLLRLRFPRSVRHTALPLLPRKHTALKLVRSTSNRAARAHRPPIILSTPHSCPTAYQTHTHVTEMFKPVSVIQARHVAAPWDTNKVGAGRRIDKGR